MKIPVSLSLFILSCTSIGFSTSNTVIHPASFKSVAVDTILDISCSVEGAATASSSGLQLKKCVPRPNSCQILTPVRRTNTTYYYKEAFNVAGHTLTDFICNSTAGTGNSSHLTVVVGYKPRLPDTVDCISLNKADLKCTWKIPEINLKNSVQSNWTITYSDGAQAYRPCPEPKPIVQESTIHCNIPEYNVELMDTFEPSSNYTMNVTLESSIGVASRLYQITVSNIVKITPPTMRLTPRKDTLEVSLELPSDYASNRNYRTSVVEYVVSYWTTWSKENKTVTVSSQDSVISLSLKDCVPYNTYFVSMKAKPRKSLDQYWSDVTTQNVTTKPDVPYDFPVTSPGLYTISNTPKTKGFTVFYKPLMKRYWNSKDCVVNVKVSDQVKGTLWTGNFTISKSFLEIPLEITDSIYTATFRYVNNQGASENSSSLSITKKEEEEESKMVVTVEETESGYFITWDMYDVNSSAITVMWCTRKSARTCENDVQWKVFQNPGKGVHLSGIGHEKNKLFAVAVHQENQTSGGLTFPKCYYTLQNSQDNTKLPFTAERLEGHQLAVKLVSLYCQYPSKPVLYQVFYQEHKEGRLSCQDVISDLAENVTQSASYDLHSIMLTNINPQSSYDVCLRVTLANNRTLSSDIQTIKSIKHADVTTGEKDGTIVGVVFGILFAAVLIGISVRYFKRKCCTGDAEIKMPPIEPFVPLLKSNESNSGYNHDLPDEKDNRDIADSGTHSLPESLSSEDQVTEGDGESVSSSGIGSTKCDSDVFSPPVTPTDAERPTLLFQGKPPKPPAGTTSVAPVDFRMTVVPENDSPHTCSQHSTSNGAQLSSSCSNPLDSYMKGDLEEDGLNTLRELMESSGNFSGGYQHVLCSNSSSTCASDSENLDTCPSTPELERAGSQSTVCDSDPVEDRTFSSGGNSSWSGVTNYNVNFQIDSSGDNGTTDRSCSSYSIV